MVYNLHLRCTANVSDSGGGNVYAMVMTDVYDTSQTSINKDVVDFMVANLNENYVYNIGPILEGITRLEGIVYTYITGLDDTNENNLALLEDYSVYVLAIDTNNKPSLVFNGPQLTGNIAPKDAPEISDTTLSYSYELVDIQATLTNPVYFEYHIATFTTEQTTVDIQRFFANIEDVDQELYTYGNIDSGFEAFNEDVYTSVNATNPNAIANINSPTDYEPIIDTTKLLHTYIYTKNNHPHNQHTIYTFPIPVENRAIPSNIMVSNVVFSPNDNNFTIRFNVLSDNSETNINYYISVFPNEIPNISGSGFGKKLVYNKSLFSENIKPSENISKEIDKYYDKDSDNLKPIVPGSTYFVYLALVDSDTGETSNIYNEIVIVKKAPEISHVHVSFNT